VMISGMVEQVDALHGGARRIMAERDMAEDVGRHLAQQTVHQEQEVTLLVRECGARDDRAREIQRAREVAEKEVTSLSAEVERLKARVRALDQDSADAMENWRLAQKRETNERIARKAAESRLAAIRETKFKCQHGHPVDVAGMFPAEGDAPQEANDSDEALSAENKRLAEQLASLRRFMIETACPHSWQDNPDGSMSCVICRRMHYPCSATCTHDDAANPGHPERVKERSEAFMGTSERSLANGYARLETLGPVESREGPTAQSVEIGRIEGFNEGAEAMRAACIGIAQGVLVANGLDERSPIYVEMTRQLEGAAP
jgi:hypothetical protein